MVVRRQAKNIRHGHCCPISHRLYRIYGAVVVTSMQYYIHPKSKSRFPPQFKQMDEFCMTLDSCNLVDLGFIGYPYTWNNKRPRVTNTRERLDWAVANAGWRGKFSASTVTHLFSHASDHRPLVLQMKADWRNQRRMSQVFKFEESWLLWEDCEKTVLEAWNMVGGAQSRLNKAKDRINKCGEELAA